MKKIVRLVLRVLRRIFLVIDTQFDHELIASDVPLSGQINHSKWQNYLYEIGNKEGMKILQ